MSTKRAPYMSEADLPSSLSGRSRGSRFCRRALAAGFGFTVGAAFLLLIGFVASLDAFMPSNGIYRNVSHTNMGILKAMLATAVNNMVARYGGATNQSGADSNNTSEEHQGFPALINGTSPLLVRNRSLAFHAELRHQYHLPVPEAYPLVHPLDATASNDTSHGAMVSASVTSAVTQEPRSDLGKKESAPN